MKFEFETKIKESKKALNTAANVAEILKKSEVYFTTTIIDGVPAIFVKKPGAKNLCWVASLQTGGNGRENHYTSREYGNWWVTYARQHYRDDETEFLFPYLTDAATEMVKEWIEKLCDEYEAKLNADAIPNPS